MLLPSATAFCFALCHCQQLPPRFAGSCVFVCLLRMGGLPAHDAVHALGDGWTNHRQILHRQPAMAAGRAVRGDDAAAVTAAAAAAAEAPSELQISTPAHANHPGWHVDAGGPGDPPTDPFVRKQPFRLAHKSVSHKPQKGLPPPPAHVNPLGQRSERREERTGSMTVSGVSERWHSSTT